MDLYTETQSILSSDVMKLSFDSIAEDSPHPWYSVIRNLTITQIESLHVIFKEKSYRQKLQKLENKGLNKEEFVNAIDEVYGSARYSVQAILLYEAIDKNETNVVTWIDFIDFLIEHLQIPPPNKLELQTPTVFTVPHIARETIMKIVLIETELNFCYAIISKHGHVGLYDGNMNFLTSYHVIMTREDILVEDAKRRRRHRWITDALFCKEFLVLLITNSARSIIVYDASGLQHTPLWLILSLPNAIQCFSYFSNDKDKTCTLFMGDDNGETWSLKFLQPKKGFLRRKHNDKLNVFYWQEIIDEKEYVLVKHYGKTHGESVDQICYLQVNNSLLSCSRDANASIVNKHIANRRKAYIFKMNRGARCFVVAHLLKMLITGSNDGTIRLWNFIVTSTPIAIFTAHRSGIIDIQIMGNEEIFFSCSQDGVLKMWNAKLQTCLQSTKINYPAFSVLGKTIEWGTNSIYPGPKRSQRNHQFEHIDIWKRSHIMVTCCNYIAQIKLIYFGENANLDFESPVLPPPSLQNNILIPSTWKICENHGENNIQVECPIMVADENIKEHTESLKFILDKDLITENNFSGDINYKLATLERQKCEMKWTVERGAPYLALDLHDIEEIVLPPDLPVPNDKSCIKLAQKIQQMLSAASSRDHIFSELSSSGSKSSRSSIVEFD